MAYQIDYAYTCHTGKVRTNNEDNFWCCGVRLPVHNQGVDGILAGHTQHWQLPMLAVFDGMGGEITGFSLHKGIDWETKVWDWTYSVHVGS